MTEIDEYLDFELYDILWWWDQPDKPNATDDPRRLALWLRISHKVGSDICYWLINETGKLVSNTLVEHIKRDDYLKPDIKSRINEFNNNLSEGLDDVNLKLNGDMDGKFDFILPDEDFIENIGVIYDISVTPTDEEYDNMIVEGRPDEKEEVIDKYINMNLISDVGTKKKSVAEPWLSAHGDLMG